MRLVFLLILTWSFAAVAQDNALHLLDSGEAVGVDSVRGGTAPPTGPTPIFYPPASPSAAPAPPGFGIPGAFFGATMGAHVGNYFLPGVPGYPSTYLSAGGVPGFDVTGAFAWHLAPTTMASLIRVLGVAAAPPPSPASAPALVVPGFMSAPISSGFPAPSGFVGGPGLLATPIRVTSPAVGIFCGLAVGGAGFAPIVAGPAGNGLGGISGIPAPPIRTAPVPLGTGAPIAMFPAPPAAYIAGCFADSSTTPVELQAYEIE